MTKEKISLSNKYRIGYNVIENHHFQVSPFRLACYKDM